MKITRFQQQISKFISQRIKQFSFFFRNEQRGKNRSSYDFPPKDVLDKTPVSMDTDHAIRVEQSNIVSYGRTPIT